MRPHRRALGPGELPSDVNVREFWWLAAKAAIVVVCIMALVVGIGQGCQRKAAPFSPREEETMTARDTADNWVAWYAQRNGVDWRLAVQVANAENPAGRRDAWSPTGCCVGIMQINVRVWFGRFDARCGGSDLLDPRVNACYGVAILGEYLRACGGRVRCALWRYNGARTDSSRAAYLHLLRRYGPAR